MTKISELTSIVTAAVTDIIAVVQDGVTKRATVQDYRDAGIIPTADQATALAAYEAALAAAEADQVLTASGPGEAAFAAAAGGGEVYQKIVILFSQLSVNPPTSVILENTTGESIQAITYDGIGNYTVQFTGSPIVDGKSTVFIAQNGGMNILFTALVGGGAYLLLTSQRLSPTISAIDGKLTDTAVEIRIYP